MLLEDLPSIFPSSWFQMDHINKRYEIFEVPSYSQEYQNIEYKMTGNYYSFIEGVYRIQNPCLYTKFSLKVFEYQQRGEFNILPLFHDTGRDNVESIANYNFDWKYGERFKYGPGVYFSSSPMLANKHSSKHNGKYRSMFLADVLIQNVQVANNDIFLPDYGFDTVRSINNATYVKYFDSEYYPHYVVNYICV